VERPNNALKEVRDKRANNGNEFVPIQLKIYGKQVKGMVEVLSFTARDDVAVSQWLKDTKLKGGEVNLLLNWLITER
jgi:hypothetical protein